MAAFTAFLVATAVSEGIHAWQQHEAGQSEQRAGRAQQEAANSEADLADWNAGVADKQAADAAARGIQTEKRYRDQVAQIIGTQRTGFAAFNVDINSGSAAQVRADTERLRDLDVVTIRKNAALEAMGYRVQAQDLRQRAVIARKTGDYAALAGQERATQANWSAATTALGTTTSLVDARYGHLWRQGAA